MDSGGLYYSKQFAQKVFHGQTTKDAYMKAVKWYASNIIAKDDLHEVQVEFIKGTNQVTIKLFVVLPEQVVREEQCRICKEMHQSLFINDKIDCNACKLLSYQKRMDNKMQVKYHYYSELFRKVEK